MTTRTQVAHYVARALPKDRAAAVKEAAAWLIDTGQARQADYLAQDVATLLADQGYVLLKITTARELDQTAQEQIVTMIKTLTKATEIEIVTAVDPSLIGGVLIETPSSRIDTTVKRNLQEFVEGATR